MKLDQILRHYKDDPAASPSQWSRTAAGVGVTTATLANWRKYGTVPLVQQRAIQMLTDGKLRAAKK